MARKKKTEEKENKPNLYKEFLTWLFDGDLNSNLPTDDLIKTTSPINHVYILRLFLSNSRLAEYLNTYFNNQNIWYLGREELLRTAKKWVHDFRLTRNSIPFIPYQRKNKLFNALRPRLPTLKNYDIDLLCDILEQSEDRDSVYSSLGLENSKVEKIKKRKILTSDDDGRLSYSKFIDVNFSVLEMK